MAKGAVISTDLPLPVFRRGKVRDVYDLGDRLLMVASDRISAFDVVMSQPIPGKGSILTSISAFWFDRTEAICPNHVIGGDVSGLGLSAADVALLSGRSMVVRKARALPVECVVRGYLAGSAWREYDRTGAVTGYELPVGLRWCERLPEPIFTPATKADEGHDENITPERAAEVLGGDLFERVRSASLGLYRFGHDYAAARGLILADTKFEFGITEDGLTVIDEMLTPDSSRYWPTQEYEVGRDQPSFDKEPLRQYLAGLDWDKSPPPPELPDSVVADTRARYEEAHRRITGRDFRDSG